MARRVQFLFEVKCHLCHGKKKQEAGLDLRTVPAMLLRKLPVRDPDSVAVAYGRDLGIAFSEAWRVAIGSQTVVLSPGTARAVIELAAEAGTPPLDAVLFGVRWRRTERQR